MKAPAPEAGDYFPLPRHFKQKIKDGLVAVAMANCLFARALSRYVFSGNGYFKNLPVVPPQLLALGLNILLLTFVIWMAIGFWRRTRSNLLSVGLELLFLSLLVFPLDFIRAQVLGYTDAQLVAFLKNPLTMIGLAILLGLILWKHRLVARKVAATVVVTCPVAFLVLIRILLLSTGLMEDRACPVSVPSPPLLPVQEGKPRVVWIIFDETDYRLAFEHRPAGVNLPAFDRLRRESLSAENAYAPADMTIISMPALITGQRLSRTSPDGCDLALTVEATGQTNDFSKMPTVFSKAREMGYNTALLGWFVPYGRLIGASLNYCAWYGIRVYQGKDAMSFGGAMLEQLSSVAWPFHNRRIYISICQRSLEDSLPIIADPKYGLTLLHFPPPHFPGVYLPDKKQFTCLGIGRPWSYLNNLALADSELAVLRKKMEDAGQWDKTWVILSADHSWRSSKAYDGIRDYRVPYLVKSPAGGPGLIYSKQFNTLLTHDLILSILGGEVTTEGGVADWLNKHATSDLPVKPATHATFE